MIPVRMPSYGDLEARVIELEARITQLEQLRDLEAMSRQRQDG